jgi:hypothetical protein
VGAERGVEGDGRRRIAAALLSLSSPGTTFVSDPAERAELAAAINQDGAAIVAHPDRFGLLATLPLPDVEAAVAGIEPREVLGL